MGMVARYRSGHPSFVEWHDGHPRISHGRLSLSASGHYGTHLVASNHALSFSLEYDHLLHGWQKTRDSQLGGGEVPATPIAPAFTIEGFSDVSFDQHSGWALRASAKYQMTRRWSLEPEYIHWNVSDSPVNYETATFTVNRHHRSGSSSACMSR